MENLFAYGSLREKKEAKTVLDGSKEFQKIIRICSKIQIEEEFGITYPIIVLPKIMKTQFMA
jgi:gamma-glutamylcyclotransferase (GGCT)/AIG2-like uncharacterized protein YtfP